MEKLNNIEIIEEFKNMILSSWTYDRMTEKEKKTFLKLLAHPRTTETVKGTKKQRMEILNAIYWAYLQGIGYNGCEWRTYREIEKDPLF